MSREEVVQFGPDRCLIGVVTHPSPALRREEAPMAVILNAGALHRVGPMRLNVYLARSLAASGVTTMRLDLSGLGDSRVRSGRLSADRRAVMDVVSALDHLQAKYGQRRFTLMGLCSGAYNAHLSSLEDRRVVGAVFIDGIAFRTLGFYFRHYILPLLNWRQFLRRWRRPLSGLRSSHSASDEATGQAAAEAEFFGPGLRRQRVAGQLRNLMARGNQLLFIYSGGVPEFKGLQQFREMFRLRPNRRQLQVEYYPHVDHTLRLTDHRQQVCRRIVEWYGNRFP
jgi:pimeloyl-ACP methyl ester carboxylesterase